LTTFGLVHGAGHGAWCWDLLTPLLEAAGHAVVAPDLPCADETADASRYAAIVSDALDGANDVILVGHSLAGIIVPLVAASRPVRHLVYLCCGIAARPGQRPSVDDPQAPKKSDEGMRTETTGTNSFVFPPEVARAYLYSRCSAADSEWAIARLRPQSRTPRAEVCPLARLPDTSATCVLGLADRAVRPDYARYVARERLGLEPIEIDTDHSPFLSAPRLLADLLLEIEAGPGMPPLVFGR